MNPILSRGAFVAGALLLVCLAQPVAAQVLGQDPKTAKGTLKEDIKKLLAKAEEEYRIFFNPPKEVLEFWAAISFEINLGKFDIAALHLDKMLQKIDTIRKKLEEDKKPPEEAYDDLLKIEEAEGFSTFLRLQKVRKWSTNATLDKAAFKNVDTLISRLTDALEKRLGDPVRIKKFMDNLHAPQPEVRAYAFAQLHRSRGRAAPYLLAELRRTAGKLEQSRLLDAMVNLEPDIIPPMLEALNARDKQDAQDVELRVALLDLIRRRADKRAIPYLWNLSSNRKYPDRVRAAAATTLAYLLETAVESLPRAKVVLTQLAEDLYQHKVRFLDPKRVPIWRWTEDHKIEPKAIELKASQYEDIFANRYLKQALELDPAYRPAQVLFLSLTLERAYDGKLDQLLTGKTSPSLDQLLLAVDAGLVVETLDRALADHNLPVILPTIKALGERGDFQAARPGNQGPPGPLVRALYYPDRRVQFAAASALLRMPSEPVPVSGSRVVELLRRFVAATPTPKALVVYTPATQIAEMRKLVKAGGFEPVFAADLKEAFAEIHKAADIDVILLHHSVPGNELPHVLAQLRADGDVGLTPLLLIAPAKAETSFERFTTRGRNIYMLPEVFLKDAEELKTILEDAIKLSAAPDAVVRADPRQRVWLVEDVKRSKGQKLTDAERKQFAAQSMDALWKMAQGLIKGYDVRPAEQTVVDALRNDEMAVQAIEILTSFSGAEPQQRLAAMVLDPGVGKKRVTAALALNKHIQKNGLALNRNQIGLLRELHANSGEDATLRAQVAILVGNLRSTPALTGAQLYQFKRNDPPPK